MSFRTEFPAFPANAIPSTVFGEGWTDVSFRNDVCPTFEIDDVTVFVDWPNASDREYPELPRYRAYVSDDIRTDPKWVGEMCESDTWSDILTFIAGGI